MDGMMPKYIIMPKCAVYIFCGHLHHGNSQISGKIIG